MYTVVYTVIQNFRCFIIWSENLLKHVRVPRLKFPRPPKESTRTTKNGRQKERIMQVAEVGDIARQWKELREYLKQNSLKVPSIIIIESNRSSQLISNTCLQGHEFSTVIKVLVQIGGKEEASVVCCG